MENSRQPGKGVGEKPLGLIGGGCSPLKKKKDPLRRKF
jgi:hypothetical protein